MIGSFRVKSVILSDFLSKGLLRIVSKISDKKSRQNFDKKSRASINRVFEHLNLLEPNKQQSETVVFLTRAMGEEKYSGHSMRRY